MLIFSTWSTWNFIVSPSRCNTDRRMLSSILIDIIKVSKMSTAYSLVMLTIN